MLAHFDLGSRDAAHLDSLFGGVLLGLIGERVAGTVGLLRSDLVDATVHRLLAVGLTLAYQRRVLDLLLNDLGGLASGQLGAGALLSEIGDLTRRIGGRFEC